MMSNPTRHMIKSGAFVLGAISVYASWNIGTYSSTPGRMPLILMLVAGVLWGIMVVMLLVENQHTLQQAGVTKWMIMTGSSFAILLAFLLPWILLFALLVVVGMP